MLSQKEAVYAAIIQVTGYNAEQGPCKLSSKEAGFAEVKAILVEGFKQGKITLKSEPKEGLDKYVVGLINNWVNRDTRLNGGSKYQAKNPGSRSNSSDEQIKEMRLLLKSLTTEEEKAEVQKYIDARQAELNKAKVQAINFDVLPEALKSKFTK